MPDSDLHWEEYKLLQSKLDNAGDFRFRVKAWVVSLVSAIIIGSTILRLPWTGLLGIPIILLFWMLEKYYDVVQSALTDRLRVLEPVIRKSTFNSLDASSRAQRDQVGPQLVSAIDRGFAKHRWIIRAHGYFYVGSVALVLCHLVFQWLRPPKDQVSTVELTKPITLELREQDRPNSFKAGDSPRQMAPKLSPARPMPSQEKPEHLQSSPEHSPELK